MSLACLPHTSQYALTKQHIFAHGSFCPVFPLLLLNRHLYQSNINLFIPIIIHFCLPAFFVILYLAHKILFCHISTLTNPFRSPYSNTVLDILVSVLPIYPFLLYHYKSMILCTYTTIPSVLFLLTSFHSVPLHCFIFQPLYNCHLYFSSQTVVFIQSPITSHNPRFFNFNITFVFQNEVSFLCLDIFFPIPPLSYLYSPISSYKSNSLSDLTKSLFNQDWFHSVLQRELQKLTSDTSSLRNHVSDTETTNDSPTVIPDSGSTNLISTDYPFDSELSMDDMSRPSLGGDSTFNDFCDDDDELFPSDAESFKSLLSQSFDDRFPFFGQDLNPVGDSSCRNSSMTSLPNPNLSQDQSQISFNSTDSYNTFKKMNNFEKHISTSDVFEFLFAVARGDNNDERPVIVQKYIGASPSDRTGEYCFLNQFLSLHLSLSYILLSVIYNETIRGMEEVMHSRGIQGLCKMIGIKSNGSKKKMLHRILNKVLPSSSYIEECVHASTSSTTETSSQRNHQTMPNSPSNSTMNSSIHNNHHTTHSNSNESSRSKTRNSIPNVSDRTSSFSSLHGIPLVSGISFRSFASIIKKGTLF